MADIWAKEWQRYMFFYVYDEFLSDYLKWPPRETALYDAIEAVLDVVICSIVTHDLFVVLFYSERCIPISLKI